MSWETLLVGTIVFKKLSREEVNELIEKVCEILEVKDEERKIEEMEDGKIRLEFDSLNWTSHVDGKKLQQTANLLKGKTTLIDLSLYYLQEADEYIYVEEENELQKFLEQIYT